MIRSMPETPTNKVDINSMRNSGDLVRCPDWQEGDAQLPNMFFVARRDHQVKRHGVRIDLDLLGLTLRRCPPLQFDQDAQCHTLTHACAILLGAKKPDEDQRLLVACQWNPVLSDAMQSQASKSFTSVGRVLIC